MTKYQSSNERTRVAHPAQEAKPRQPSAAQAAPEVTSEEKHHLAQCCAFFKAEHFRDADPAHIRAADIDEAEAQIDAVVKSVSTRQ